MVLAVLRVQTKQTMNGVAFSDIEAIAALLLPTISPFIAALVLKAPQVVELVCFCF